MDIKKVAAALIVLAGLVAGYFGLNLDGCKVTDKVAVEAVHN